ncbi:MAG TPA: FeoA family protein [Bacteroidota bacterium]|nr:FeoA family protein [Bacteroidota bacterium]
MNQTLMNVESGLKVRIAQLRSRPETCRRLREMGFCENAVIRCVMNGDGGVICEVCDARVGLNAELARDIVVSTVDE